MSSHVNAGLTFEGRKVLVERIAAMGRMSEAEASGNCTGCAVHTVTPLLLCTVPAMHNHLQGASA